MSGPFRDMRSTALAMHELYTSYVEAGFSEAQAFELVKIALAAAIGSAGGR